MYKPGPQHCEVGFARNATELLEQEAVDRAEAAVPPKQYRLRPEVR
ncbi:MAG: hypothetical protein JO320_06975 [Alphaproteobacteria bacterium]|nr:hypothetical protein [Alphaproteobacteria bacterium]